MKISVLGSGCATCRKLHETVKYVVKNENIDAEVEYSDDIRRIVELGLMRSPVLVVDGVPVDVSSTSEKDVKEALCGMVTKDNGCCAGGTSCDIKCAPATTDSKKVSDCSCGGNC